jgi:phage baseplate assembly protein gpV
VIEDMLSAVDESIDELKKKFYGVTTGRVINPLDPMMLGRVQVQLPFIDAVDFSPWARVATPMAGRLAGDYFIPNVGDEVLVAFEHGDINAPYVLGSLWSVAAPPPMPSPLPQIRAIRTPLGNQIVFTEEPASVTIQTSPTPPVAMPAPPAPTGLYHTISLNPAGVQVATPTMVSIMVGTTSVIVTPSAVNVQVGSSTLTVTPGAITMQAPTITLAATGKVSIMGSVVTIN